MSKMNSKVVHTLKFPVNGSLDPQVSLQQAKVKLTKEGRAYLVAISKTRPTLLNGSLLPVGVEKRLVHEDIVMFRGGKLGGGGVALRWTYPMSSHRGRAPSKGTSSKKNGKGEDATTLAVEECPERSTTCQGNQNRNTLAVSKVRVRWASVVEEIPELVPACLSAGKSSIKESISPTCGADLLLKEATCVVHFLSKEAAGKSEPVSNENSCGSNALPKEETCAASSKETFSEVNFVPMEAVDGANEMCKKTSSGFNTLSKKANSPSKMAAYKGDPLSKETASEDNTLSKEAACRATSPSREAISYSINRCRLKDQNNRIIMAI